MTPKPTNEPKKQPDQKTDLVDVFAFVTLKGGEKWSVFCDEDEADGYPYSLYREDEAKAFAAHVDALLSLVRDDYCNDPERLAADLSDRDWLALREWAEAWENRMSNA